MAHSSDLSFTDSLKTDQRKAFYEGHKDIALVMVLVVFLFPIFGVYVGGLFGAALGMLISIAAYFLTPYVTLNLGK
jgi:nitrate reductase NapE component